MAESSYDFGSLERLDADAVGRPGQRTFRMLAWAESRTACLWLEKEELLALATYIEQLLVQLGMQDDERRFPAIGAEEETSSEPVRDFPLRPTVEFKVGRLGIGYDEDRDRFLIVAHDPDIYHSASSRSLLPGVRVARSVTLPLTALANRTRARCRTATSKDWWRASLYPFAFLPRLTTDAGLTTRR